MLAEICRPSKSRRCEHVMKSAGPTEGDDHVSERLFGRPKSYNLDARMFRTGRTLGRTQPEIGPTQPECGPTRLKYSQNQTRQWLKPAQSISCWKPHRPQSIDYVKDGNKWRASPHTSCNDHLGDEHGQELEQLSTALRILQVRALQNVTQAIPGRVCARHNVLADTLQGARVKHCREPLRRHMPDHAQGGPGDGNACGGGQVRVALRVACAGHGVERRGADQPCHMPNRSAPEARKVDELGQTTCVRWASACPNDARNILRGESPHGIRTLGKRSNKSSSVFREWATPGALLSNLRLAFFGPFARILPSTENRTNQATVLWECPGPVRKRSLTISSPNHCLAFFHTCVLEFRLSRIALKRSNTSAAADVLGNPGALSDRA